MKAFLARLCRWWCGPSAVEQVRVPSALELVLRRALLEAREAETTRIGEGATVDEITIRNIHYEEPPDCSITSEALDQTPAAKDARDHA